MSDQSAPAETEAEVWSEAVTLALQRFLNEGAYTFTDSATSEGYVTSGVPNIARWQYVHATLELEEEIDLLWTIDDWSEVFEQVYREVHDKKLLLAYHWIADLRADFFASCVVLDSLTCDYEYHASALWAKKLFDLNEALDDRGTEVARPIQHTWIH